MATFKHFSPWLPYDLVNNCVEKTQIQIFRDLTEYKKKIYKIRNFVQPLE